MLDFNILRGLLFLTVIVYFVFEYFDNKQIKDEREELIRLKTFELVHKVTITALCVFTLIYILFPDINSFYPILTVVFSFLYTEIFGKIYFRKKL